MLIATPNRCANASVAEISLMKQEIALYRGFAQEVATQTGEALLRVRLDNERLILSGSSTIGRSAS